MAGKALGNVTQSKKEESMLAEWLINCLILLESFDISDSTYFALKESLESEDECWRLAFEEHLTPTEALLEWLEEHHAE